MRKVQPFTIGTKLSIPSDHKLHDHTPELHLTRPSVTSQPPSSSSSAASVQVEAELREEEMMMKSTCEHLSEQEVNLALEVSLFYQRADIILSDISRTLSQSEDSRQHLNKTSKSIDDITADITVLDRCAHRLSELHPTLTARVRLKQEEVKTCWALLLQQHSLKQSHPPEDPCSQFGYRQEEPEPEPPVDTTLNKNPPPECNQQRPTVPGRVSPDRCDEPPDRCSGVTPLASSISIFLNFDPQMEETQNQGPAESHLTPPPSHLVSRCVQVTGENRETHQSGDEPYISSSSTTFLPRVSTIVLPPSPSTCSVSTLNLQPLENRRRRQMVSRSNDEEEEEVKMEEEEEECGKMLGTTLMSNRSPPPPVNTELLLYVQSSSVVTVETETPALRLDDTAGNDVTQVTGESLCCVTLESSVNLKPPTVSEGVSDFRSKENNSSSDGSGRPPVPDQNSGTRRTEDQVNLPGALTERELASWLGLTLDYEDVSNLRPKEETSRSIALAAVSSSLCQTEDQNQQAHPSSRTTRKTFTDSVTEGSSSVLHPEEEGSVPRFDPVHPSSSVLGGLDQTQDQNQPVSFSSSAVRKTTKNSETIEHQVRLAVVSSEASSGGLVLSLDLPTGGECTILSDPHPTQDQSQPEDLSSIREISVQGERSENQVKPPGMSSESPEEAVHGDLSTSRSTIIQDHHEDKTRLMMQEGTFIQNTDPHPSTVQLVHQGHHCFSVHTKTCDLRDHIYQPVRGHAVFSVQKVDEQSAFVSSGPGLRWSGRVVDCLADSCCICSSGLKPRQETESSRWLFDEVEDELEIIWTQSEP
ncbi:uncharacterized protein LOC108882279 isoform X2 [Lates calcarifer]|uniref:Uncharacterized protein LOC108882279 isoform X2 n=1 Tax=Lates calcarifer TaxID=8187 RepID=A0AAJ7LRD5_LATCA|nr:uncharacterized protein LOC108882279 isoform X2 [Lates calcarifer]